MKKKAMLREPDWEIAELSGFISSRNLISGVSREYFNQLSKKILRLLSEGAGEEKLERVIESELCVTYGLFKTEFDAAGFATDIIRRWNEKG